MLEAFIIETRSKVTSLTLALTPTLTLTPALTPTVFLTLTPTPTPTLNLAPALTPTPTPTLTLPKVSSDEEVEKVSQEEERTQIATDFEASEDWLYEDGKDLVAADYQKRKKELEKQTSPIFLRLSELEARYLVITPKP